MGLNRSALGWSAPSDLPDLTHPGCIPDVATRQYGTLNRGPAVCLLRNAAFALAAAGCACKPQHSSSRRRSQQRKRKAMRRMRR
jgi:hypothetical protein